LALLAVSVRVRGALSQLHSFPARRSSDLATITFTKSSGSSGGSGSKSDGKFRVGDTVETTGTLTLRTRGGLGYGVIASMPTGTRSEEHTSELQSREKIVCRLLREKKNLNT